MRKRVFTLFTVLLLALWGLNCDCPDDDCKSCPKPDPAVPNLAYMTISNELPQALGVQAGITNFYYREVVLHAYYGPGLYPVSQESIVITSLTLEDTYTGNNGLSEIANIKLVADLNGCVSIDEPTLIGSINSAPNQPSPQYLEITLDTPIILSPNTCIMLRVYGDLLFTADTTTPGSHNIEVVGITGYGVESFGAITEDNGHLYVQSTYSPVLNIPATPGTMTLSVDASSPLENIYIAGSASQTVAAFRVSADDKEDIKLNGVKITDIGKGTAISTCYLYSNVRNDGLPITDPVATAPMFPTSPPYCRLPADKITVAAGTSVTLTVKVNLGNIDNQFILNGDISQLAISDQMDITGFGQSSGQLVTIDAGEEKASQMLIFAARPNFSLNVASPSGALVPSMNTLLAIYNVQAVGDDISFSNSAGNYLTIEVSSVCTGANLGNLTLKDESGNILSTIANVNLCIAGSYTFNFNNLDLTIANGTTKKFYIYADTTGFMSVGDMVQIYLSDSESSSKIGWSISGDGQNYGYGNILFRGSIYANALVKP